LALIPKETKWFWTLSGIACSIKILLQLGSTIPSLSQLAFGFRPIVIGYLHLVLLGFISIFLITYTWSTQMRFPNKKFQKAISLFVLGIIINEILLMTQGIAALKYWSIPYIDLGLLVAAFIMFMGIGLTNIFMSKCSTTE